MKTTTLKLKDALLNTDKYIQQMKALDDAHLCKHINLYRQQMQLAWQQRNMAAYELLYEYERQTLIARAGKAI